MKRPTFGGGAVTMIVGMGWGTVTWDWTRMEKGRSSRSFLRGGSACKVWSRSSERDLNTMVYCRFSIWVRVVKV